MEAMDPSIPPPPPATEGPVACKRHPDVQTGLRCVRCGDPICPDCMRPAAVGYQCPDCARGSRQEVYQPGRRIGSSAAGLSVTNALIAICVGVYVIGVAMSGAGSIVAGATEHVMIKLGADQPFLVASGQYWRLFTSMFLHFGIFHLALNMYALYVIGNVVESELGRVRYLALFLVTGWFSSAIAYWLTPPLVSTPAGSILQISAGASGAIFGLFGVFLAYNYRRRHLAFYANRMRQMLMLIVVNMVFTFTIPGISWQAHVGGLIAGLIAGYAALDGFGPRISRTVALVTSLAGLLAVSVVIVAMRTADLQAQFARFVGRGSG
jgi:membrane associated rhomboid family serine protease